MSNKMVTLTLAHPLPEASAKRVRAQEVRDYKIGEKIKVPYHEAHGVISSGYATVDPEDDEQVQAALGRTSSASAKSTSSGSSKSS
ncbi:hypothetical protein ACFFMN_23005 [Planobispora siamensis]|uniref:Uncharacterized protein n=1 Tax=Planobispora siamensis TaxID=936338 RepID=A0A8J3SJH7_9ACTN|nr:hypothetical protein [Planobispora siamensis]GIH95437.1 hypothetical protein Psi01_60670 [Planobispora siamensis]